MVVFGGLTKPPDALKPLEEALKPPRISHDILTRGPPLYPDKFPEIPRVTAGHIQTPNNKFSPLAFTKLCKVLYQCAAVKTQQIFMILYIIFDVFASGHTVVTAYVIGRK